MGRTVRLAHWLCMTSLAMPLATFVAFVLTVVANSMWGLRPHGFLDVVAENFGWLFEVVGLSAAVLGFIGLRRLRTELGSRSSKWLAHVGIGSGVALILLGLPLLWLRYFVVIDQLMPD